MLLYRKHFISMAQINLIFAYEYFTYESKIISRKALTDLENSYINRFNFENLYNFKDIATSSLGYKYTEEARLKMVDYYKDKNNHPMYGKTHSFPSGEGAPRPVGHRNACFNQ